jgi:Zn ribbon nucleic-acid-binding protein
VTGDGTLTPAQKLLRAQAALKHIWSRWHREPDKQKRETLWVWVAEAELRLLQAKRGAGLLIEGVCPECQHTDLFVFKDEHGRDRSICKKCGWADSDDLQAIIRETARRTRRSR